MPREGAELSTKPDYRLLGPRATSSVLQCQERLEYGASQVHSLARAAQGPQET